MDYSSDHENDPRLYDDVSSREFRERPRAVDPRDRSDDYYTAPPQRGDRPRRKSILVDPSERAQRPRADRRDSQVRLRSSDDENGGYIPIRRPPIGSEASRIDRDMASRHDLERKNTQAHRSFREKRDGYESDEGETLKRTGPPDEPRPRRRGGEGPPPPGPGPGPDEEPRRRPRDRDGDPRDVERRPRDRGGDPRDVEPRARERDGDPRDVEPRQMPIRTRAPPVQYGNEPVDPRRRGGEDYLAPGPDPRLRRSASNREPRARAPAPPYNYEDDDDDDYRQPPRRNVSHRDPRRDRDGDRDRGDPRDPRRRPRYEEPDGYDPRDRGYRSDRDGRRRPAPRYDDYYSDGGHSRGYNRPPPFYPDERDPRRDSYGGGAYGGRRGSRDRRDRYRDDYDDRDRGDRHRKRGGPDWQATAATAFATYAMPMIKKEGTKFLKDFISKQAH
ncbi:hypothetical protein NA57DRAFT_54532 [Rhizodiscina lignyota]|uniref:Uncharacterized protein n=1 Tax=Rhizodiscina lignyota TaxID=1504668 RepID=A0A9P4II70_9PEZI|nr:hypothetical protein NA57DRAFT_54532 [Rhizodiscina lignyota]